MTTAPFRRIVTGHNDKGEAIFLEDVPPPRVVQVGGEIGPWFYEVWNTTETPAHILPHGTEPPEDGIKLAPPRNGTRIRVLDIPPEDPSLATLSPEEARKHFAEVGAGEVRGLAVGLLQIRPGSTWMPLSPCWKRCAGGAWSLPARLRSSEAACPPKSAIPRFPRPTAPTACTSAPSNWCLRTWCDRAS